MRIPAALIILTFFCTACSNLSKSDETLRNNYLVITQHGTSMDEAISLIKRKIKPKGELEVREGIPCLKREEKKLQKGSHSIRVNLGWYYWGVIPTTVYGEWCFNDNRQLIDIIVYKDFDESRPR